MYSFNYHRAGSLDDASAKFAASEDAKFVAGGQTLLPTMKQRLAAPADVIDLRHVEGMRGITVSGNRVRIGAATTHNDINTSAELRAVAPGIADMAGIVGDPHVRHMGTIGGVIANNDPAADYPAMLLALDATVETNKREIAAADYFTGMFETALEEGEIVTAVSFDAPSAAAYEKFRNPASRYAMAGAFVARTANGPRVAIAGAGNDGVFRLEEAEQKIASGDIDGIDGVAVDEDAMLSDLHASAAYRANLVRVMAKRAAERCASGGGAADHTQGTH